MYHVFQGGVVNGEVTPEMYGDAQYVVVTANPWVSGGIKVTNATYLSDSPPDSLFDTLFSGSWKPNNTSANPTRAHFKIDDTTKSVVIRTGQEAVYYFYK